LLWVISATRNHETRGYQSWLQEKIGLACRISIQRYYLDLLEYSIVNLDSLDMDAELRFPSSCLGWPRRILTGKYAGTK